MSIGYRTLIIKDMKMKYFGRLFVLLCVFIGCEQEKRFVISGEVKEADGVEIRLVARNDVGGWDTLSRTTVENGKFLLKGMVERPLIALVDGGRDFRAVPVFVDVECATCNLDPALLEGALSERTRAVMVAHTLGNPFDLARVKAFCDEHHLWLIEDNCDALGAKFDGKFTGTWGDIGTSSFYPAHHITTGEGGAVYTSNPTLRKIMLSLRDWGRDCWCDPGVDNSCGCRFTRRYGKLPAGYDHKYVYSHFGYNLKASDMQAAVGCAQLEKLPGFVERRQENFRRLYDRLRDLPELQLPTRHPDAEPSWFGFLIILTAAAKFHRNDLVRHLESRNIQTRNLFAGNLTKHPCFESLEESVDYRIAGDLANTDRIMNDAFWIGLYPGMSEAKLDYMIDSIREFVRK